jgi:hypothetical protein
MSDDMKEYRERYTEARDAWSEWRNRALEDLRFSNPANPQQWPEETIRARGKSRPALVFDQTNQYIAQVVNDARQNKPAVDVLPGDNRASIETADVYGGMMRQVEYESRAQIAYDTAIEYAARIGLGYLLVVPELVDGKHNDHALRIKSVVNPLAATLDPDSLEPDGQDADAGWLETRMSEAAFKRKWPKAEVSSYKGSDTWFDANGVLVCQAFERTFVKTNCIITQDGQEWTEDEYHAESQKHGIALPVHATYMKSKPKVMWRWLSGVEVLEETEYPAPYIGLVPVYGNLLWVDGKRQVCGMTRRMMDACRAYNYERSAYIEAVALSPKAPFLAPARAIAKYQQLWDSANTENRSVLPYDHVDGEGNPIPTPTRQAPPMVGSAFADNAQMALQDIQASVGMYKANLGQNSNAKSGVAINKLQTEGDTATFHYIDNLSRSIEQVGRICVHLIPKYYDRARVTQILGVDGKSKQVRINPELQTAHQQTDMLEINPAVGEYSVRVKTGPSYTSKRQETLDRLANISQSNPQLAAALAPLMLQLDDMPGAEKVAKIALAMLPPELRAAYEEDDSGPPPIPPEVQAQLQQMQQALQQVQQMAEELHNENERLKADRTSSFNDQLIKAYDAETKRISALGGGMSPEQVQMLAMQTVMEAMNQGNPGPDLIPPDPPDGQPDQFEQAPQGAFSLPEQGMEPPPAMAATGAQPGPGTPPDLSEGPMNV